jgi:hypothetical protein
MNITLCIDNILILFKNYDKFINLIHCIMIIYIHGIDWIKAVMSITNQIFDKVILYYLIISTSIIFVYYDKFMNISNDIDHISIIFMCYDEFMNISNAFENI